jgi:hypothetical protein
MTHSLLRSRPSLVLILLAAATAAAFSQSGSNLERFFKDDIGLTQAQIDSIRGGTAFAKALPSRTPAEIVLFGAVYINAVPEKYVQFAADFERRRKLSGYVAVGVLDNPPRLEDFDGFSFDQEDMQALKKCKPADCQIQMPASAIQEINMWIGLRRAQLNR